MHSSRAQTQNKTPTVTRELESATRIGGTDKSKNQLDDDGKRGWGSGQKRHWQQQHGRAPAVDLCRLQRQRLAAEVNGEDRRLWRQAEAAGSGSGSSTCGGSVDRRLRWWRRAMEEKEKAAAAEPSDFVSVLILPLHRCW
jgi:hypothetical protein